MGLFVQMTPQVPVDQLDPKHKTTGLLVHTMKHNIRLCQTCRLLKPEVLCFRRLSVFAFS